MLRQCVRQGRASGLLLVQLSLASESTPEIPLIESTQIEVLYSEGAQVLVKLCAASRLQYKNGNSAYPLGVQATCYDQHQKITATLRANSAYQLADQELWELKGDVEVRGYHDGKEQQLNTEALYWDAKTTKIYTDKFVRLETDNELLTGYGFEAMQDLSYYAMDAPKGFVNVEAEDLPGEKSE
eukprot:gene335-427_t